MGIFAHYYILSTNAYITLNIKEYPVFKPNEYFFKHHWSEDSGEEKWETYAKVIRKIIAASYNI